MRPPSLCELTPYWISSRLTHLDSKASKLYLWYHKVCQFLHTFFDLYCSIKTTHSFWECDYACLAYSKTKQFNYNFWKKNKKVKKWDFVSNFTIKKSKPISNWRHASQNDLTIILFLKCRYATFPWPPPIYKKICG